MEEGLPDSPECPSTFLPVALLRRWSDARFRAVEIAAAIRDKVAYGRPRWCYGQGSGRVHDNELNMELPLRSVARARGSAARYCVQSRSGTRAAVAMRDSSLCYPLSPANRSHAGCCVFASRSLCIGNILFCACVDLLPCVCAGMCRGLQPLRLQEIITRITADANYEQLSSVAFLSIGSSSSSCSAKSSYSTIP